MKRLPLTRDRSPGNNPEVSQRRLHQIDDLSGPLLATSFEWEEGALPRLHAHRTGQLVFSGENVITVRTQRSRIVVPPNRGVWVPPGVPHETQGHGLIHMHSLFVHPDHMEGMPAECIAVSVGSLLRELILHAAADIERIAAGTPQYRLAMVILDQLRELREVSLKLPMPSDRRVLRVCDALLQDPADDRTLPEWGDVVGASTRTLSRLFTVETGMSFHHWRQQARLLAALPRLSDGESVTSVALDLGYQTPSSFITMFKSVLGVTPGAYFSTSSNPGEDLAL